MNKKVAMIWLLSLFIAGLSACESVDSNKTNETPIITEMEEQNDDLFDIPAGLIENYERADFDKAELLLKLTDIDVLSAIKLNRDNKEEVKEA